MMIRACHASTWKTYDLTSSAWSKRLTCDSCNHIAERYGILSKSSDEKPCSIGPSHGKYDDIIYYYQQSLEGPVEGEEIDKLGVLILDMWRW